LELLKLKHAFLDKVGREAYDHQVKNHLGSQRLGPTYEVDDSPIIIMI